MAHVGVGVTENFRDDCIEKTPQVYNEILLLLMFYIMPTTHSMRQESSAWKGVIDRNLVTNRRLLILQILRLKEKRLSGIFEEA